MTSLSIGVSLTSVAVRGQVPRPPAGYILLVDDDGAYLLDETGAYLMEQI